MNDYCIIGAGLSGISLAKQLKDVVILEKSKGIGGRLSARRLGSYSLNHGPQEIQSITDPHGWIKHQSEGLNVLKSWEVSHLELFPSMIRVNGTKGQLLECKKVILTMPAPQSKALLEKSGLAADFLVAVRYKAVIQFMLLADAGINTNNLEEYFHLQKQEFLPEDQILALFELKEEFLPEFLEKDKETIKSFCLEKLNRPVGDCHAHKWRYSEVRNSISPQFQTKFAAQGLFLAGDYFGSDGMKSALESIEVVLPLLRHESRS